MEINMKELVEVIAKALVENPDEVVVTETENDKTITVELRVAPSVFIHFKLTGIRIRIVRSDFFDKFTVSGRSGICYYDSVKRISLISHSF